MIGSEYKEWLSELKSQIKRTQIKASVSVNSQLIMLYWDLGRQITEKQETAKWGSGFIEQLSRDLRVEFPEMSGLSLTNLKYCKQFYIFYLPLLDENQINQQLVGELQRVENTNVIKSPQVVGELQHVKDSNVIKSPQVVGEINKTAILLIPWGHHRLILNRCKNIPQALFYISKTIENTWSRSVLEYQIETNLYKRQGKATTNFKLTMPEPESDLANEIMKSEYNFEFLRMTDKVKEADLEKALIQHMAQFLTELGKGFAYMGRQYPIKVGTKDFKIDLLFYHTKLKCYIVIELKVREFDPDFTGKLVFYTTAVDELIKDANDKATIGILLCKDKDDIVVDYSLKNINSPIGVGKMRYTELSDEIKAVLPSIEELQEEIRNFDRKVNIE